MTSSYARVRGIAVREKVRGRDGSLGSDYDVVMLEVGRQG